MANTPETPRTPRKRGPVKRKPYNFNTRFTAETVELLDDLAQQTGLSRTDVIEQSVRALAQQQALSTHAADAPSAIPKS